MTGGGIFSPSFGIGHYTSYFCTDFHGAKVKDAGIFANSRAASVKSIKVESETEKAAERPAGGWVQFQKPDASNQIIVRVGLSFISEERACQNAEKEIPNN